jgi:hypothetical protein
MAKAPDKILTWMPFAEALARAGSLEALLSVLMTGDAMARAADFLVNGRSTRRADRSIPSAWWKNQNGYDLDPAAGRAKFRTSLIDEITIAMTAIGIEIEAAPLTARWPAKPITAKRHRGGRIPDHDWEGAARYIDALVRDGGPLPRNRDGELIIARVVDLMTQWFIKHDVRAPNPSSIYRWIRENPRSW